MAINTMLHTKPIGLQIVSLIKDNLFTSMGLKIIQLGGIEYLPAPAISANIPSIFIKPSPSVDIKIRQLGEIYEMEHKFKLIYVNSFVSTEKVIQTKIDRAQSIAELFLNDISLGGLTLTNGTIEYVYVSKIEFEPVEDDFVFSLKKDLFAVAIYMSIFTLTEN